MTAPLSCKPKTHFRIAPWGWGLLVALAASTIVIEDFRFTPHGNAPITNTESKIRSLEAALMAYKTSAGSYPTESQGLQVVVAMFNDPRLRWGRGRIKAETVVDPWENKIQYRIPGLHNPTGFDLYSLGPDRIESADDIGNW